MRHEAKINFSTGQRVKEIAIKDVQQLRNGKPAVKFVGHHNIPT